MVKNGRARLLARGRLSKLRISTVISQSIMAEFKPPLATVSKKLILCSIKSSRICGSTRDL